VVTTRLAHRDVLAVVHNYLNLASVCLATGRTGGQLDNCALEIGRKLGDGELVLVATAVNQDVSVLARFRARSEV